MTAIAHPSTRRSVLADALVGLGLSEELRSILAVAPEDRKPEQKDALAAYGAQTALGRIVTDEEVAAAAHFLVSDAASGLTGVVLPVEAGL